MAGSSRVDASYSSGGESSSEHPAREFFSEESTKYISRYIEDVDRLIKKLRSYHTTDQYPDDTLAPQYTAGQGSSNAEVGELLSNLTDVTDKLLGLKETVSRRIQESFSTTSSQRNLLVDIIGAISRADAEFPSGITVSAKRVTGRTPRNLSGDEESLLQKLQKGKKEETLDAAKEVLEMCVNPSARGHMTKLLQEKLLGTLILALQRCRLNDKDEWKDVILLVGEALSVFVVMGADESQLSKYAASTISALFAILKNAIGDTETSASAQQILKLKLNVSKALAKHCKIIAKIFLKMNQNEPISPPASMSTENGTVRRLISSGQPGKETAIGGEELITIQNIITMICDQEVDYQPSQNVRASSFDHPSSPRTIEFGRFTNSIFRLQNDNYAFEEITAMHIYCCESLTHLADVPICLSALVKGCRALDIIKYFLDFCTANLVAACSAKRPRIKENDPIFLLVYQASISFLNMMRSEIKYASHSTVQHPNLDKDILRSEVLESIVIFIRTATKDYNETQPLLPRFLGRNLALLLHQCSSRHFRPQMVLIKTPHAIAALFSHAAISCESAPNEDALKYLECISYWCLDALTYFLTDKCTTGDSNMTNTPDVVKLLANPSMVKGLKYLLSQLNASKARLATLHVVSNLTEWEASLSILVQGDITKPLFSIAPQLLHLQKCTSKSSTPEKLSTISSPIVLFGKKIIESSGSDNMISSLFGRSLESNKGTDQDYDTVTAKNAVKQLQSLKREHEFSLDKSFSEATSVEESIIVCAALANIAHANVEYSSLMFQEGLLDIMLQLIRSDHAEVCRQALRCVSAICRIMPSKMNFEESTIKVSDSAGDEGYENLEAKEVRMRLSQSSKFDLASLSKKVLDALVETLHNDNSIEMHQREAILGIAGLAMNDDENIIDLIFRDALETICTLMDDGEKDLLDAAEAVLINCGFDGGMDDFELCTKDFTKLKNWGEMKRWLYAQRKCYTATEEWFEKLFPDDIHIFEPSSREINAKLQTIVPDKTQGNTLFDFWRTNLDMRAPWTREVDTRYVINDPGHRILQNKDISLPPSEAEFLRNLFFPSRIHRLFLLDLLVLGEPVNKETFQYDSDSSFESNIGSSSHKRQRSGACFVPHQHEMFALALPAQVYHEALMTTLSKVLEKTILECTEVAPKSIFALSFANCSIETDFIESFLVFLANTPQIAALTFQNSEDMKAPSSNVKNNGFFYYLGSHVPSSIRFLSFKSCLTSFDVIKLCGYLENENAAFKGMPQNPYSDGFDSDGSSASYSSFLSGMNTRNSHKSLGVPTTDKKRWKYTKGLLGLCISGVTEMENEAVQSVCNILAFKEFPLSGRVSPKSNTVTSGEVSDDESASEDYNYDNDNFMKRGLKYLDVSNNDLTDKFCRDILIAASKGPLEGLDLGSNQTQKADELTSAFVLIMTNRNDYICNTLRHLSLRSLKLPVACVCNMLEALKDNATLTSFDIADNCLRDQNSLNKMLKDFVSENKFLRSFDLSQNDFNEETASLIEAGILKNTTLLLLHYQGNNNYTENTQSYNNTQNYIKGIEKVLSKNRACYKLAYEDYRKNNEQPSSSLNLKRGKTNEVVPIDLSNVLHVFFAAPLALRDYRLTLQPAGKLLAYKREGEEIKQVFADVSRDLSVKFGFATSASLRTALTDGCHALHFSGHGHPKGIWLEDGCAGLQLMNRETLVQLFRAGGDHHSLEFVFLAACYSEELAKAFVELGVKHVICVKTSYKIQDNTAVVFTKAFYRALLNGKSVIDAFNIGTNAVASSPYVEEAKQESQKFTLLPSEADGGKHDEIIFNRKTIKSWPLAHHCVYSYEGHSTLESNPHVNQTSLGSEHVPSAPIIFVGRQVDMYRVISEISRNPVVILSGEAGIGKSALVYAACTYMADRRTDFFRDGIIVLKEREFNSYISFLQILYETLRISKAVSERLRKHIDDIFSLEFRDEGNGTYGISSNSRRNSGKVSGPISSRSAGMFENTFVEPKEMVGRISRLLAGNFQLLLALDSTALVVEDATEISCFLNMLQQECPKIKVLLVCTQPQRLLDTFFTIVEIKGLDLKNSIHLYSRLSPALNTGQAKDSFVTRILSIMSDQKDLTVNSRGITTQTASIFQLLGNGNPKSLMHAALRSTEADLEKIYRIIAEEVEK